jgi:hypothetical protein
MEEDYLKRLAELKRELEQKKLELEKELELIKFNLVLVDKALSSSSFVTADVLLKKEKEEVVAKKEVKPKPIKTEEIKDVDETLLFSLNYHEKLLEVIPNPSIKFKEDSAPFKNFLVKKVFEGKRSSDIESGKSPEESFDYEIFKDTEGNITSIILKNVNVHDQQEVRNLTNSIKWTIKRIKEKIKGGV